jgi:hypothetical protein
MRRVVLMGAAALLLGAALTTTGCKGCHKEGFDGGVLDGGTDSGATDSGPVVVGSGCEPLQPGDPVVPGGLGACCEDAVAGGSTPECQPPLGCLNGFCTLLACGSDADCSGAIGPSDRSPFPVGTTFGCVTAATNVAALQYCAPLGVGRRECAGPTGEACAAGETCVIAWDPDDFFGAVCETNVSEPASIRPATGPLAEGDACNLSSVRPCATNGDCRTVGGAAIETCDVASGTCVLVSPYTKYQCPGMEGPTEFVRPGVFMVTFTYSGPGGILGMEGGCLAGLFGSTPTCTSFCDPAINDCATGFSCAPWDFWADGTVGICVAQECRYNYGPIPANDTANIVGLTIVAPPSCTTATDCDGFNGGAFGSRCIDTDGNGVGDTCEFVDRVTLCPPGMVCGRSVWSDFFNQGVPAMDALARTDLDTFEIHCVPEMPGATGVLGDPCEDGFDCLSGLCTRGDLYDPTTMGSPVAVSGTCTEVCMNDASCAAASGSPEVCINYGIFGGGATSDWPLCVPAADLFMITYCQQDADCAANEGCGFLAFRTGTGACLDRTGVLADQTQTGVTGILDEQPNGATCYNNINRCTAGDDGVEDSTVANATAGSCANDDQLANSNNCASGICFDGDDLSGGTVDGPAVCSGVCNDNSDCVGPQICGNVLLNNNSTDDGTDDTVIGLCLTFQPVTGGCTTDLDCAPAGVCDDGIAVPATWGETFGERSSGICYALAAAIGDPCTADTDCNLGNRCIADNSGGDPTMGFTGGYCVMDGCAYDPMTGVGTADDCPGGATAAVCANTGAAGTCFDRCVMDSDCRNGPTDYTCQEVIMGSGEMGCLPPPA